MFHDPFSMVVAIIAILTIGKVLSARYKAQHGIVEDGESHLQKISADPDSVRMKDEIAALKERIQVLERIATDNNSASDINRQIEQLRDR
jgi:hypothetical protein